MSPVQQKHKSVKIRQNPLNQETKRHKHNTTETNPRPLHNINLKPATMFLTLQLPNIQTRNMTNTNPYAITLMKQ